MKIKRNPMSRKLVVAAALLLAAPVARAAEDAVDPAVLAQVRDAAMKSDWAYQRLQDLTDKIGGRLSGSPQAAAAVEQVAAAMRQAGLVVKLEPVMVPHWVRGEEHAELVAFPGQVGGFNQHVVLTALGGSSATPAAGLRAEILVVRSFDELKAKAASVPGRIVLFDMPFDTHLQENGLAGPAYGQAGAARFMGPSAAAKLGAAAVLVRSISGAVYRLPHTGMTIWGDGVRAIPAAAVTAEDTELMVRLARAGPVSIHLTLTPQTLPDVESANVIADLPGSDLKDEVVLVSGHLDSWDLAQGAIDDGAGVTSAMGAVQVIQSLHLKPRRTIRFVAWMNEENGSRGEKGYTAIHQKEFAHHAAVIESDTGAGRPLGIMAYATPKSAEALKPVMNALGAIGASVLDFKVRTLGSDLEDIESSGAPGFEPLLDVRTYFDYHHTAADTLDKVDPANLQRQVAVMATLVYFLAESPQPLERMPVKQ
jgi:carboxypeptidase Q